MTIIFATSNRGKFATLERYAHQYGVNLERFRQKDLDIIEPQADTATEVARVKAREAYRQLGQPVVVDDSSFHITALGGFPGPYIKYMISTIGAEGILDFMKDHADRSAYFLSTLVYIDETGTEHIFEDEPYRGTIAPMALEQNSATAWSDLHRLFIPDGTDKFLAQLTDDERAALSAGKQDAYAQFCQWLAAH